MNSVFFEPEMDMTLVASIMASLNYNTGYMPQTCDNTLNPQPEIEPIQPIEKPKPKTNKKPIKIITKTEKEQLNKFYESLRKAVTDAVIKAASKPILPKPKSSFELSRTRSKENYRINKTIPKTKTQIRGYKAIGTIRKPKNLKRPKGDKTVEYKRINIEGGERNWYGHRSPDQLPKITELYRTHRQVLEILMHRAYSQNMIDIKITNQELASLINRSIKTVSNVLSDLTDMGFIGTCQVVFTKGKCCTWRMIRLHNIAFLYAWNISESATWLGTDFRPDSMRGIKKEDRKPYYSRATNWSLEGKDSKIHPKWWSHDVNSSDFQCKWPPAIDPDGEINTGIRIGAIRQEWVAKHWELIDLHLEGNSDSLRVIGKKRVEPDLDDWQTIA